MIALNLFSVQPPTASRLRVKQPEPSNREVTGCKHFHTDWQRLAYNCYLIYKCGETIKMLQSVSPSTPTRATPSTRRVLDSAGFQLVVYALYSLSKQGCCVAICGGISKFLFPICEVLAGP